MMKRTLAPIRSFAPLPHPLAMGLVAVLAGTAVAPVTLAGNLNNQTADVVAGDPVETWNLSNGSQLTVTDAATQRIETSDSRVSLLDASVSSSTGSAYALRAENSEVEARDTYFRGQIFVKDNSTLLLTHSTVEVRQADLAASSGFSVGVDVSYDPFGGEPLRPESMQPG